MTYFNFLNLYSVYVFIIPSVLKGTNESELIDESNIIQQNQSNKYPDGMIYSILNINLTKSYDGAIFRWVMICYVRY